ncbi:MAG: hypothetical protein HeimC3_49000 [Candidatus Heimdallarchaeota archaeon LC_3]|nr:MAG: hypothetical protein HeimC3_49000 [Candidatus Heimdallarchaeota archaeon LC_3]
MENIDFTKEFKPSKHFRNTWMRKWNCDLSDIRIGCLEANKIQKIGKSGKYEIFFRIKNKKVKIIISCKYVDEIFIISGAEGH